MTNHNFTQLDNELIDVHAAKVGRAAMGTYWALCRFAQGQGQCWPSQETLAKRLHCTVKTLRGDLDKLEAIGLIKSVQQFRDNVQQTNLYQIIPVTKNPGAVPTDGVAALPEQEARSSRDCDGPPADVGDYEPYDPADDAPLSAPTQGGDDVEMFKTDEDVLIAIADIRQRNQDYLIRLLEDDGEGWPTDDDYPLIEAAEATDRDNDRIAA